MAKKIGPNEPCPCGSGKKFKKCCRPLGLSGGAAAGLPHTPDERASAFAKLDFFIDELWSEEEEDAFELFWGRYLDREDELSPELLRISRDAQEMWFAFDHDLDDDRRIVDHFLEQAELTPGERSFLEQLRRSTMRLYNVEDTVPGTSMTLRDLTDGTSVTVSERSASRSIARHECIAARVIPRGRSGRPEIEAGVLHIPSLIRDAVFEQVQRMRRTFLEDSPASSFEDFWKTVPPLFHDAWLTTMFDPPVPRLANTDGEEMVATRASFHVDDAAALARALDGAEADGIERRGDDDVWEWSGPSANRELVSLARLEIRDGVFTVETNSVTRGERARALVERLAGGAIRHRATTHEDVRRKVVEGVTARALGRVSEEETNRPPGGRSARDSGLDPDVAEALSHDFYARHYRAWIDEPVPALDDRTPRQAVADRELRLRLEQLLGDLDSMYERALKDGEPAYDPSWIRTELGLAPEIDPADPPPIAHERVYERVPGCAEACQSAAERFRGRPSFDDRTTTLEEKDLTGDLEIQRFVRRDGVAGNDSGQERALVAGSYLPLLMNLELHRRKVFWVDPALSFMLESTDADVPGSELKAPFPSFAMVFHDRHALSLGERLLARHEDDPLRGQILRVITAYVTERHRAGRSLEILFALDALGADLPSLVRYEVPADDDTSLAAFLESLAPRTIVDPPIPDASPVRGLLRLVLNAILYATSAGVSSEVRTVATRRRSKTPESSPSGSVYFLPGKIDIRQVRQMQELQRAPGGRALLARFMVRGHWRRPAKNWTEQRVRWIAPYWKGPDMGAVIEKAYRLKP